MASSDSPAVARRRLRLALRRVREDRGVTQQQVAEALEWSLSKVNRIESGDVTISNTDLRALLSFLGVTDPAEIERLTEDARASRRRGWWDEPRYREHLTPATLQMLQFESEASVIRCFQPTIFPGLLQTPGYARSVLDFWRSDVRSVPEDDIEVRLEVRLQRKGQVLEREQSPQYLLILDESVVLREVGGAKVMAEQLSNVVGMLNPPQLTIRVLRLADGALMSTLGAFTVFDLNDEEDAILYRETNMFDDITQAPAMIAQYRGIFEQMWERSLGEDASKRLIQARAATMLATLDRN